MYWKPNQKLQDGKYIIENVLGSGGFGITYKAKETASGKLIAIKTLNAIQHQKPNFEKRQVDFINEAMCLARFSHPHIPQVDRVFKEDDIWGVVMEYIDGENLDNYIFENKRILSLEEALKIISQVGDALTYVHQRNFLHRDVKPLNILLRRNSLDSVLIDFGLARKFVQGEVMTHTDSKTEGYAPIEQYERRAERGTFTDVYALAATYYVMRTGKVPIPANFRKEANIPLVEPKQYNSEISERENAAILKGMELLPQDRPQTVKEWLDFLKEDDDDLRSERGVDYLQLRNYLKAGMWREADLETERVMLKVTGKPKEFGLSFEELDNFPCTDLRTIDSLWVKYSDGRFGFSVQKHIYESLGGTREWDQKMWDTFGDHVGWRVNGEWLFLYDDLQFSSQAKIGNLPWVGTVKVNFWLLFSRMEICNQVDDLSSDQGVDYSQLRDYLKAGMWREADEETAGMMLKVAEREEKGWLDEIDNFPSTDLRTIDRLWLNYSDGRFGFSVQKRIYESLGSMRGLNSKWEAFGDHMGWRVKGEWLDYKNLQFNKQAKSGHLPCCRFIFSLGILFRLFYRLDTCNEADDLTSYQGVDYSQLRDYLKAGMWTEADEETVTVMLKAVRREKEGCLTGEDIDNFPSTDLKTIDKLWRKYSDGRFGFSVQKRIYQSLGSTREYEDKKIWQAFGDRVGWRVKGEWLYYTDLPFNKEANSGQLPEGHLPWEVWTDGGLSSSLLSRRDL